MDPTPSKAPRPTPICHRMIGRPTTYSWQSIECCGSVCALWVRAEWAVTSITEGGAERVVSPGTGRCADNRDAEPWNDPALASATDATQDEE